MLPVVSAIYPINTGAIARHDEQGGGKLGLGSCISQCQREDGGEHDALSQIQGEERYEGYGSTTYHHYQCSDKRKNGTG